MEASIIKDVMPVITALIVSISTLLGIYFTNKFNSKQAKVNLELARDHKMVELRLQKLEELYFLFEQWETNLSSMYLIHLRSYVGQLTYSQVLDMIIEKYGKNDGQFQRIQVLVNIYFTELREDYKKVMTVRSSLSKYLSDPSANGLKKNDFIKEQEQFENICEDFKNKLSDIQKLL